MTTEVNLKKEVASRLKQARKALDLSQKSLCTRIDMAFPTYRDYEVGRSLPSAEALAALMRAGIAPAWVLTGAGDMFCRPAEVTGLTIASAIRISGLSVDDVVEQLGIEIHELLEYLEGRRIPGDDILVKVAVVTGYPQDKLLAARDMADALAKLEVMHARVTLNVTEAGVEPVAPPVVQKINVEALAETLRSVQALAKPGETPEALAHKAARFYAYMLEEGFITPDGVGEGHMKKAG